MPRKETEAQLRCHVCGHLLNQPVKACRLAQSAHPPPLPRPSWWSRCKCRRLPCRCSVQRCLFPENCIFLTPRKTATIHYAQRKLKQISTVYGVMTSKPEQKTAVAQDTLRLIWPQLSNFLLLCRFKCLRILPGVASGAYPCWGWRWWCWGTWWNRWCCWRRMTTRQKRRESGKMA